MALGSILGVLLIIMMKKGAKHQNCINALTDGDNPLKNLYVIGYGWSETKILSFSGRKKEVLVGQAKLLYEPQYSDFYATASWAQVITFVHLSLCIGLLLGGAMNFTFFSFVGVVFAAFCGFYFFTRMKEKLSARHEDCITALPEVVSTMVLLINAGMPLRYAWSQISESKDGEIYTLMKKASDDIRNGSSESDAIFKFGVLSNTPEVKKFASFLVQGLETDAKDLGRFLADYSTEMWSLKKQVMLQKGEQAASKLLIPVSLIFLGILIIVISGALGTLLS